MVTPQDVQSVRSQAVKEAYQKEIEKLYLQLKNEINGLDNPVTVNNDEMFSMIRNIGDIIDDMKSWKELLDGQ